jgi:hypothetical protein
MRLPLAHCQRIKPLDAVPCLPLPGSTLLGFVCLRLIKADF